MNRLEEYGYAGPYHRSSILNLCPYPRANGAKRRSGRKPGARVTNFVLAEFKALSFTNISGGAARHEKVSPKTWRILAFADAIWFLSLQVFTTDQPRSRAFKKTFAPLVFAKNFMAWLFSGKNQRKNRVFFARGRKYL